MTRDTLESLGLTAVAFLTPIQGVLATVLGLVALDLLTGKLASRKRLHSHGLRRSVVKLGVYELSIVLAYFTGVYLTGPGVPVLHLVSSLIGLTELKSVYENLNVLSGRDTLGSVVDAIQRLSSNPDNDPPPSGPDLPPAA